MKQKWKNIVFLILPLGIILLGCESGGCLKKQGGEKLYEVQTGYFEEINIRGMFDIILVQDTSYFVEFEAKPEVIGYLEARVSDSILWLDNSNRCFYTRDYTKIKVFVHFTNLRTINTFEVCRITSRNVITSNLRLTIQSDMAEVDLEMENGYLSFYNNTTTGGIYTFRGNSSTAVLSGYHTGQFNFGELHVGDLHINNSSIGDMHVRASEKLTVQIHNRGNIYYYGSPGVVIDSISGSGKLVNIPE